MSKEINPNEYNITKKEKMPGGAHSSIDAVNISIGNHEVPLLKKEHVGYSADFMSGPEWHSVLKKRGYPVLPTWRYDKENGVDYITDLRRGGTHRVVDFCGGSENYNEVFISNFGDLESEAEILASKLADDGIIINEPNIFFDVEISTGISKIIMGDLREMGYESEDMESVSRDQIFAHNKSILDGHMSRLKNIMIENGDPQKP